MPRTIRALALAACCATALPGCGGGGSAKLDNTQEVEEFINSMEDVASAPGSLKTYFAAGAAPDKATLGKYRRYSYSCAAKPRLSGSEATVKVKITERGKEVGEQEWTLVKDDKQWRLKSAPLP
jgi:hypothetical protein